MEYKSTVHHDKLNVDFSLKIDAEAFNHFKGDHAIECFEGDGNCRKFLKDFLTLKEPVMQMASESIQKKKKKKLFEYSPEKPEPEVEEKETVQDESGS